MTLSPSLWQPFTLGGVELPHRLAARAADAQPCEPERHPRGTGRGVLRPGRGRGAVGYTDYPALAHA